MKRRTKLLMGILALLVVGCGVAAWLAWFPPWAAPLERKLLGAWEGTGEVSGEWSIDVKPDPEHGVEGGKASGRATSACTARAEFKPDGTYTWQEHQQGGGISFDFSLPKDGGPAARWEVVRARGSELTIRIHAGEAVFDFQGENAFKMTLPESAQASGTYTFRRVTAKMK